VHATAKTQPEQEQSSAHEIEAAADDTQHVYLEDIEITHTQQWIQGVITSIYPTNDQSGDPVSYTIIVDDGTSVIGVSLSGQQNQCNMPNGKTHRFLPGDYVMVVGALVLQDPYDAKEDRGKGRGRGSGIGDGASSAIITRHTAAKRRMFHKVSIEAEYCLYLGTDPNLETLWSTEVILGLSGAGARLAASGS